MTGDPPVEVQVAVADPRIAAAIAGFLEPAGHRVRVLDIERSERLGRAAVALVDWSLTDGAGGHLGTALRRNWPGLWVVALVPADLARAEAPGCDAVVTLPLARDSLVRAIEGRVRPDAASPDGTGSGAGTGPGAG